MVQGRFKLVVPLYAPPGAGKDVLQGHIKAGFEHRGVRARTVPTGAFFRKAEEGTDLTPFEESVRLRVGPDGFKRMREGHLLDDDLTIEVVQHLLENLDGDILILDGAPRTGGQAERLRPLLHGIPALTVCLHTPLEICEQRMIRRRRPDDQPETVANRMDVWKKHCIDVLNCLVEWGEVLDIDTQLLNEEPTAIANMACSRIGEVLQGIPQSQVC